MTGRRPPMPEPPPRRRRAITRGKPWRVRGPAGDVTTVQLAERVMSARAESICPRCKCPVGVGVQIGLIPGTGWCHVRPCIIGGRMPMIGPSNEPT